VRAGFIAISLLLTVLTLGKKSWLLSLAAVALTVNAAVAGLFIGGFGGDNDGFCWDSAVNGALWGAQIALMVIAVVSLGTAVAGVIKKKIAVAKKKKASTIAVQEMATKPASAEPNLGNKLDYAFGKATGNSHNIERSLKNAVHLNQIGIHDNPIGRQIVNAHLVDSFYANKQLIMGVNNVSIDTLLAGPGGFRVMKSFWNKNQLITFWFLHNPIRL